MHIRIAITDDHPMVISGLKNMLYYHKHIEICNVYSDGDSLLAGLLTDQPDILLLDIQMPGKSGNELARIVNRKFPAVKIIAVSSMDSSFHVKDMMQHGCKGYLLKTVEQKVLIEAIERVYEGEEYLEQSLKDDLMKSLLKIKKPTAFTPELTRREKEILQLVVEECTSQDIASRLFLSLRTVENHRFNLLQKLGAKNTVGMVKIAQQMGLV